MEIHKPPLISNPILVVEDREALRSLYVDFLKSCGYRAIGVPSAEDARSKLEQAEFALILSDYMLPGQNGLDLLRELKQKEIHCPYIIMTAFGEVKLAVEAMRAGAIDFLEKPIDLGHLDLVIKRALALEQLQRKAQMNKSHYQQIIGNAPAFKKAIALAEKVAPSDANVLLLGETGSGKSLFSRMIHDLSDRKVGNFVAINCAAIPHNLMESELFGHEKGAFTGASMRKMGLVEVADGGSLFLDEIGELPIELQSKLLRVIQDHEFYRVGGSRVIKSNIRILCATNRDLKQGIRDGWFREDLYYRLAVFPIAIPPLRERPEDIEHLARYILQKHGVKEPQETWPVNLCNYHWPGNVRELENLLERALILSHGEELDVGHFPKIFQKSDGQPHLDIQIDPQKSLDDLQKQVYETVEQKVIRYHLENHQGDEAIVARKLGLSRRELYNKIVRFEEK